MIVDRAPRFKIIVSEVWKPLTVLFCWDVIVTLFYWHTPFHAPELPLTLLGTGIGLFLGFRVNSAYQRWWEARTLWGALINASRSLARAATAYLPLDADERRRDLSRSITLRQIAYVHALRRQLRKQPPRDEIRRFLSEEEAHEEMKANNPANAILDGTARRVAQAQRDGLIDTIQQTQIEGILVDIANAQGGMERIKNTPLPNQYRFFPDLFSRIFCVLLPIGLVETLGFATPVGSTVAGLLFLAILATGDDLADPFANTLYDVPMTSMCRTIEINLLETIGDPAPEPPQPDHGVLW